MEPRLDVLTLAVPDLDAARGFYCDGLGWTPTLEVPGTILFLQLGHGLLVGLFPADQLAADLQVAVADVTVGSGFTLAHNVPDEDSVRRVLAQAENAGGRILKPAQRAAFGGYHGYFADPAGLRWEVCFNPGWSVDGDGTVRIAPVEPL